MSILTNSYVSGFVLLLDEDAVTFARDDFAIDISTQASVEMSDSPSQGESSPITSVETLKSAWQNNLILIRAISAANYVRSELNGVSCVRMSVAY
jgi:hypothetical protein